MFGLTCSKNIEWQRTNAAHTRQNISVVGIREVVACEKLNKLRNPSAGGGVRVHVPTIFVLFYELARFHLRTPFLTM